MKLHIFNPEHDIALAHNDKFFTPPRAGRQLRHDCGFLPALWAEAGDYVLVDDVDTAKKSINKEVTDIHFVTYNDLSQLPKDIVIDPWGWDGALCFHLHKAGVPTRVLRSEEELKTIRSLSSRQFSSEVLREIHGILERNNPSLAKRIVGEATFVSDYSQLEPEIAKRQHSVLKEPWSSSGRGVRYVNGILDVPMANWARNIIDRQGGIMVEPYYNKVCDFGMEFTADNHGVHYRGLSIFSTVNGFYTGNVITSEDAKRKFMERYLPGYVLDEIQAVIINILNQRLKSKYLGPLGVDMMVINGNMLHPMVEINLRRTMGHVAIDIANHHKVTNAVMKIDYDGKCYKLNIVPTTNS